MHPDTIALLKRILMLLNSAPRFGRKRLGLDSYEIASQIEEHLRIHGEPQ